MGHPDTLASLSALGSLLQAQGLPAKAEKTLRIVVAGLESTVGKENPRTLGARYQLGLALQAQSKLKDSERSFRRALEGQRQHLGNAHPDTKSTIQALAGVLKLRIDQKAAATDDNFNEDLDIEM